jgi:hypothetical protein
VLERFRVEFEGLQRPMEQVMVLKPKEYRRQFRMPVQEGPFDLLILSLCPVEALELVKRAVDDDVLSSATSAGSRFGRNSLSDASIRLRSTRRRRGNPSTGLIRLSSTANRSSVRP